MRRFSFVWLGLLFSSTACNVESLLPNENGGTRPTVRAGGTEGSRMAGMTEAHNQVRAQVSTSTPLPDLQWSQDLATVAQNYAEQIAQGCTLVHSKGPYGENLAFFGGSQATASEVVGLWAGEKACYTYGNFEKTDGCTSACDKSGGCGHYTQVVWRNTEVVGCGVATCAGGGGEMWVCNYDPPGNFVGDPPY